MQALQGHSNPLERGDLERARPSSRRSERQLVSWMSKPRILKATFDIDKLAECHPVRKDNRLLAKLVTNGTNTTQFASVVNIIRREKGFTQQQALHQLANLRNVLLLWSKSCTSAAAIEETTVALTAQILQREPR